MAKLHDLLLQFTNDGVFRSVLKSGCILTANEGMVRLLDRSGDPAQLEGALLDELMALRR